VAGHDAVTENCVRIDVSTTSGDECVDLHEGVGIEQQLDSLAGGQLAALVLLIDAGLATPELSPLAHFEEALGTVLIRRHGLSIRSSRVFAQGQSRHDSPTTYPQKR
jgi:hypothetical protein